MIRVLIIDDEDAPGFISPLKRGIEGSVGDTAFVQHVNPTDLLAQGEGGITKLEQQLRSLASEYWNIAAFDINLGDLGEAEENSIRITLRLAEAFRERNKAATILLYSGTLAKMLEKDITSRKTATEGILKRILRAQVAAFVPRDDIATEIEVEASNPGWLLRLDKLMLLHKDRMVSVIESEFNGLNFGQLSESLRSQDDLGERLATRVIELGIAGIVDLNVT